MTRRDTLTIRVTHTLTADEVVSTLAAALCCGYGFRLAASPSTREVMAMLRDYLVDNGPAGLSEWRLYPEDDQHEAICLAQRLGLDPTGEGPR